MKSIFEEESYNELMDRLSKLTSKSKPKWGKMNVEQMLVHCRKAIELAMGDIELKTKYHPLVLYLAPLFKSSLYNDKPYRKGLPTTKDFKVKNYTNFDAELTLLKAKMHRMHTHEKFFFPYTSHPLFGRMEPYMWGQSGYKHLDHHFRQFGV